MDHFAPFEWVDYTRGAAAAEKAAQMQAHLESGCAECTRSSEIWHLVAQCAAEERTFHPPDNVVDEIKRAYRPPAPGPWLPAVASFARLIFDSFKQPAFAMVRASAPSSRQLIHESEPFTVDLRLDTDPAHKRIYLMGQVLNSQNPHESSTGIDVILLHGAELVKQTLASASGEFDLEFEGEDAMQLFINIRGQRAIGIVLPDMDH